MRLEIEKIQNPKRKKDLGLICVSFNQKKLTEEYVNKIKKQTLVPDIIVLDNASSDGTFEYLKNKHPDITIVRTKHNYGGAGGYFVAQKYAYEAGYTYILIGENDAFPIDNNLIEKTYESTKNNPETMFSAINKNKKGVIGSIFHVSMMHRDLIKKIGFINADYFFRGDDLEYGERIIKNNVDRLAINAFYTHPTDSGYANPIKIYFGIRNELNNYLIYKKLSQLINKLLRGVFVAFTYDLIIKDKQIANANYEGISDFLKNKITLKRSLDKINKFKTQRIDKSKFLKRVIGLKHLKNNIHSKYFCLVTGSFNKALGINESVIKYGIKDLLKDKLKFFNREACSTAYGTPAILIYYFFDRCYFVDKINLEKGETCWNYYEPKLPKLIRLLQFGFIIMISLIITTILIIFKMLRFDKKKAIRIIKPRD